MSRSITIEKMNVILDTCREESKRQFRSHCNSTLSEGFVVETLKLLNAGNRKADKEAVVDSICQELGCRCKQVLIEQKQQFNYHMFDGNGKEQSDASQETDAFMIGGVRPKLSVPAMDKQQITLPVIAGGATFGLLALWACIVARGSNLGAYILLAKIVEFISNLGISLGGTAKVAHAVAIIGGPVVFGVAAALIVAGIVFGIMVATWRARYAKWVIQQFREQNVIQVYESQIDNYWDQIQETLQIELELHELTKQTQRVSVTN
ncbi:MAG: hypothetical protein IJ040_04545 [Lachnospiraceae bacterium]|nr:hypothetical protein [Lachnospiraceae bacterium]